MADEHSTPESPQSTMEQPLCRPSTFHRTFDMLLHDFDALDPMKTLAPYERSRVCQALKYVLTLVVCMGFIRHSEDSLAIKQLFTDPTQFEQAMQRIQAKRQLQTEKQQQANSQTIERDHSLSQDTNENQDDHIELEAQTEFQNMVNRLQRSKLKTLK